MAASREAYFKALEALFETAGWKILLAEVTANADKSLENGANAPNWGQVQYQLGRREAFAEIMTLEATIAQHQRAIDEDNADADL